MPVVINEIEIIDPPVAPPQPGPPPSAPRCAPLHEQLRLLQRDFDERQRRLTAD